MRHAALLLVALLLAGCGSPGDPILGPGDPDPPPPAGPPLRFGGIVVDARTGAPVPDAIVRIDLAQTMPCDRQGIGWASWAPNVTADGLWGPLEVPRPKSGDVAFFIHTRAGGYSENVTHIGASRARSDLGNLTIELDEIASVEGKAPPGTFVALEAPPGFPRIVLSAENGSFAFRHARVREAQLVAATSVPTRLAVAAPADLVIAANETRGWLLEGIVRAPAGGPLAADVVAWNGSALWSVGRSGENGVFTLALPPEPQSIRVEARTADDHYGGTLELRIDGPPALRQTILTRALC